MSSRLDLTDLSLQILNLPLDHIYPHLDFLRIQKWMEHVYTGHTFDEINTHLYHAQHHYRTVAECIDYITSMQLLNMYLGGGRIALRPDHITHWRRLISSVDPDVLVTKVLARNDVKGSDLQDFWEMWGIYPGVEDRFLAPIYKQGLVDIHIHLNGAFPILFLWLDLMTDAERPEVMYGANQGEGAIPLEIIHKAKQLRAHLLLHMCNSLELGRFLLELKETGMDDDLQRLWLERFLLLSGWRCEMHSEHYLYFLAYVQLKNRYNRHFIMTADHNPGLASFRRYFDAPDIKVLRPSRARRYQQVRRCLRLASDSPALAHVELRIAPLNNVHEYQQILGIIKKLKSRLADHQHSTKADFGFPKKPKRRKNIFPQITFVVHFIRRESDQVFKAMTGRSASLEIDYLALRRAQMTRIGKQSAILHRFRYTKGKDGLAHMITGIDVANKEVNTFSHFYTPWLRLLRGYERLPGSHDCAWDQPGMQYWRALRDAGLFVPPRHLPKLGLTYHVGEEFHHPLEGIMQMESVIRGACMQTGDRLGHGLAAGWSIESFQIHRSEIFMPSGTLLDLLGWLHTWFSRKGKVTTSLLHEIGNDIMRLSSRIYDETLSAGTIYGIWRRRHELSHQSNNDVSKLVMKELDQEVQKRRFELDRYPRYLFDAVAECEALMRYWWEKMVEQRGIIVESNPSSNLAAGGAKILKNLPGVRIAARNGGIGVALGTDDPGTFATNIEQEYALFFQGLVDIGLSRHEAADITQHVARNAAATLF